MTSNFKWTEYCSTDWLLWREMWEGHEDMRKGGGSKDKKERSGERRSINEQKTDSTKKENLLCDLISSELSCGTKNSEKCP